MARTIEKTVYKFEELNDKAKEKARNWYRQVQLDYDWWEYTYEDARIIGAILGIELDHKTVRAADGKTRPGGPTIYFSGFSSQGDGACFEGTWSWKACGKAIRDYAPEDTTLHAIADKLTALPYGEGWRAGMKHRGHYYHSGCMSVAVDFEDEFYHQANNFADGKESLPQDEFTKVEEIVTQAMRDFADWIYRQLEEEHDYLTSDEQVDESITANEYEFDENGQRTI